MSDRDTEAAHWFARMRAAGAETHRAAFEAWHADPENAAAYARAKDDWVLVGGAAPEVVDLHREPHPKAATAAPRWALAAALVLALSLGLAWAILGHRNEDTVVAGNGTSEIILEDGTRVALMDGARLDHQFGPGERRVVLTGGRARFTVAHDPSRPFRVEAGGSETTALGTIFEVDLRGPQPAVHLIKGAVEVRAVARPEKRLRLRPGQRARVFAEGPTLVGANDAAQPATQSPVGAISTDGLLIADELPLGAVLDRANRVNIVKIRVAEPGLASRSVSGRFDVANAQSLARKLAAALDLAVERDADGFILTPKIKY